MTCGPRLARLPCDRGGVVTVAERYTGGTTLALKTGGAANLPTLQAGEVMFLEVIGRDCGGCATFRVSSITGEELTVDSVTGVCLPPGTLLRYTATHPDAIKLLAAELPFTAVHPLVWDCATRSLHIDCEGLKALIAAPCGA